MHRPPSHRSPPLHVVYEDYERLSDFICGAPVETEALALLWTELLRAVIIKPEEAPNDLVRMHSVVHFMDVLTGEKRTVRLVYPDHDGCEPGDLAITNILGAALIGLRAGSSFAWTSGEEGNGLIRVERVATAEAKCPPRSPSDRTFESGMGWDYFFAEDRRLDLVGEPARPPSERTPECDIDETLNQSFPASDAPSWTLGRRPDPS